MIRTAVAILAASGLASAASPYSLENNDAIKKTASILAYDLVSYYSGNESGKTPGILPGPPPAGDYYWWEAGAMWGTLIDYWHLTGDDTYNDITTQALLHQVGPARDYQPPNYTASLGNDDQGFWGMTVMLAAEENYENPPPEQPQWLALAQAVFNTQAAPDRHDETCGGGLRWQIPSINNGYNYKNTIANGIFFNMGARLATYTKNTTYSDWAEQTWDWITNTVGYITEDWDVLDGANVETNCTDLHKARFSYNAAVFSLGAAYMYNFTDGDEKWKQRTEALVNRTLESFFPKGIAYEHSCETSKSCTTDMLSFKGYLHRWLATATQVAPFLKDSVLPVLRTSAEAAIAQCTGGASGRACGFYWQSGAFSGETGVGQTMNVLGAVSSLLIESSKAPVTNDTGGTSTGDPNAGSGGSSNDYKIHQDDLGTGDRAGAGILTVLLIVVTFGMFGWMSWD